MALKKKNVSLIIENYRSTELQQHGSSLYRCKFRSSDAVESTTSWKNVHLVLKNMGQS